MRVEACSCVVVCDLVFFTGIVRAAMKKKVTYSFKVKVSIQCKMSYNYFQGQALSQRLLAAVES